MRLRTFGLGMTFDFLTIVGLVLVSFCVATASLIAAGYFVGRARANHIHSFDPRTAEAAVFVFDQELLVDATDRAHALLGETDDDTKPWDRLVNNLQMDFETIGEKLAELGRGSKLDLFADQTRRRILADRGNGFLRITVLEPSESEALVQVDAQSLSELERDSMLLAATADSAPYLVWKTDPVGDVTWANRAYMELAEHAFGPEACRGWPPARLFAKLRWEADQEASQKKRMSLTVPGDDGETLLWFDTETVRSRDEFLHFAVPADAAVRAEGALREFIQTLAKTFAHLPIGLAIFDRSRQLALFNPAMTDLSQLPVVFLSGRPTLTAFLDELRERRVMPEPKDYKSWRQRITALEAEAESGTYEESWSLPTGQTYRVIGRPHPDGAIAFLFEDITAEISLTRRFRTDLELGQSVLDSLDTAVAVFSATGVLTLSNAAYGRIWGVDPSSTLGEFSVADAIRRWLMLAEPTPVWGDVRDFVLSSEERTAWSAEVRLKSGRTLDCRFMPLAGGSTMVSFSEQDYLPQVSETSARPASKAAIA